MSDLGHYNTSDLIEEVNDRLIKDNRLKLDTDIFKDSKYCIDQAVSGDLTPLSIEAAIDKLVSNGGEPSFAIIPRDRQMDVRRGEYFTSCTSKYVQNGLIGNYMDISVIVSSDVENGYVIEGDLNDRKNPEKICKIKLVR